MDGIRVIVFAAVMQQFLGAANTDGKWSRYIIACHTTDFACFKRQYTSLRDKVLFGNHKLRIENYRPYIFKYGDTKTCVKVSGLEDSELVAISMDSNNHEFSYTIHTPLMIQQIQSHNTTCADPEISFSNVVKSDKLKSFKANATIQATYPYDVLKKNNDFFLILRDEDIDLILDIPDLSDFNRRSKIQAALYENSEWAYEVVQHIDAAQHVALPYTGRLRSLTTKLPLHKLILLYPNEKYTEIQFDYYDELAKIIV